MKKNYYDKHGHTGNDIHKAIGVLLRESLKRLDAAGRDESKVVVEFIEQVIILMEMEKARNFGNG